MRTYIPNAYLAKESGTFIKVMQSIAYNFISTKRQNQTNNNNKQNKTTSKQHQNKV